MHPSLQQCWPIIQCLALVLALKASKLQAQDSVTDKKSWIVAGYEIHDWKTGSPLCSQVGINALGKPFIKNDSDPGINRSVGLYNVAFKPDTEMNALWIYNSTTKALQIQWPAPHEAQYCLDNMNQTSYNQEIPFPFRIMPCTHEPTQQWQLEPLSGQGNVTAFQIKSVMVTLDGKALYIRGQNFQKTKYPWLVLGLYLDSQSDGNSISTFTFIPVPANNKSLASLAVSVPSHGDKLNNLVSNGGFESCGLQSPFDYTTLEVTVKKERPYICSWTVVEGRVKVVQTSPWSWPAQEGLNSLRLVGSKAEPVVKITQFIRTIPKKNYNLSFYLYGERHCTSHQSKVTITIAVEVSPSTNSSLAKRHVERIHVTNKWKLVTLAFTALSDATNITFINTMNKSRCAPVIDHVVATQVQEDYEKLEYRKLLIVTCFTSGISVVGFILLVKDRIFGLQILHRHKVRTKTFDDCGGSDPGSSPMLGPVDTFSLKQLKAATSNFKTKVGEGGFGVVYRAKLQDGRLVAVKRATFGVSDPHLFRQELSVLLRLRHEKLVNLLGFCCEKGEQILVFEFINNGSLYERLHGIGGQENVLPWVKRMEIAMDMARALQYLHEKAMPPVIHRDVKSTNILLTEGDAGRLADFGLSKLGSATHELEYSTPPKGSYGYIDPHYNWTGTLSEKSDVYSYGVVVLEMVTGLKAMQRYETLADWSREYRRDPQAMATIVDPKLQGQFPMEKLCNLTLIINACLSDEPDERPSMKQVVAWLNEDGGLVE